MVKRPKQIIKKNVCIAVVRSTNNSMLGIFFDNELIPPRNWSKAEARAATKKTWPNSGIMRLALLKHEYQEAYNFHRVWRVPRLQ